MFDTTHKIIIPLLYDQIEFPLLYDQIESFNQQGLAIVKKDSKWSVVDTTHKSMIPLLYEQIEFGAKKKLKEEIKNSTVSIKNMDTGEQKTNLYDEVLDFFE